MSTHKGIELYLLKLRENDIEKKANSKLKITYPRAFKLGSAPFSNNNFTIGTEPKLAAACIAAYFAVGHLENNKNLSKPNQKKERYDRNKKVK
jgi:hypothetical protein